MTHSTYHKHTDEHIGAFVQACKVINDEFFKNITKHLEEHMFFISEDNAFFVLEEK